MRNRAINFKRRSAPPKKILSRGPFNHAPMTTTMTAEETQRQQQSQLPISLLDYGAGNVRSVYNAIVACGYPNVQLITTPAQILEAQVIIFPGVGSYHPAMTVLKERGYDVALKEYLANGDRPYLGICLGMQTLFEGSDEKSHGSAEGNDDELPGLGIIPGRVIKFDATTTRSVPHIGWNGIILHQKSPAMKYLHPTTAASSTTTTTTTTTTLGSEVYFVHSYYAPIIDDECSNSNSEWILTSTTYEGRRSPPRPTTSTATPYHNTMMTTHRLPPSSSISPPTKVLRIASLLPSTTDICISLRLDRNAPSSVLFV